MLERLAAGANGAGAADAELLTMIAEEAEMTEETIRLPRPRVTPPPAASLIYPCSEERRA